MYFNVEINPTIDIPSEFRRELVSLYDSLEEYGLKNATLDVVKAIINHEVVTDELNIGIRYMESEEEQDFPF